MTLFPLSCAEAGAAAPADPAQPGRPGTAHQTRHSPAQGTRSSPSSPYPGTAAASRRSAVVALAFRIWGNRKDDP